MKELKAFTKMLRNVVIITGILMLASVIIANIIRSPGISAGDVMLPLLTGIILVTQLPYAVNNVRECIDMDKKSAKDPKKDP